MGMFILIIAILMTSICIGFVIDFSRSMLAAAEKRHGTRYPSNGIMILVIGGIGLLVSLCSWIYTVHFTHVAARASDTVIEMQQKTNRHGCVSYVPTFRFRDATGSQHTVSSGFFQSSPEFHARDVVPVLYLRDDPQTARINSFWQMWGLPAMAGIIGSISFVVGFVVTFWRKITAA